jgi:quercetin dioxygenase-like cupin family protein
MRHVLCRFVDSSVLVLALAALATPLRAQDPAKVGPEVYKCTFENERVRVCEVTFKPGAKVATHSHPDHLIYILTAGKLVITGADGKATDFLGKVGDVAWSPATTHSASNPGSNEFKALVVELKQPAAKQ